MLIKNRYPYPLIFRFKKNKVKWINHIKPFGPENCQVFLILPYAGEKSTRTKNIKKWTKKYIVLL